VPSLSMQKEQCKGRQCVALPVRTPVLAKCRYRAMA
jgi:hypothetical protein